MDITETALGTFPRLQRESVSEVGLLPRSCAQLWVQTYPFISAEIQPSDGFAPCVTWQGTANEYTEAHVRS